MKTKVIPGLVQDLMLAFFTDPVLTLAHKLHKQGYTDSDVNTTLLGCSSDTQRMLLVNHMRDLKNKFKS